MVLICPSCSNALTFSRQSFGGVMFQGGLCEGLLGDPVISSLGVMLWQMCICMYICIYAIRFLFEPATSGVAGVSMPHRASICLVHFPWWFEREPIIDGLVSIFLFPQGLEHCVFWMVLNGSQKRNITILSHFKGSSNHKSTYFLTIWLDL